MLPRRFVWPLFAGLMGLIIGGTFVGTVLTPETPRTHYYDAAYQAANLEHEHDQARQQIFLWTPQDSTGFFAL